ncbi:hypothetical protein ACH3VS_07225 [Streptomyces sp. WSLK1-3]|uniref:hypothetical protein n=1 Tax=Streptomyces sp. WSLK1-3 TaxID=3375475 RepID=UPI00379DF998
MPLRRPHPQAGREKGRAPGAVVNSQSINAGEVVEEVLLRRAAKVVRSAGASDCTVGRQFHPELGMNFQRWRTTLRTNARRT